MNRAPQASPATPRGFMCTGTVHGHPAPNELGRHGAERDQAILDEISSTITRKTWLQKVEIYHKGSRQVVACKRVPFCGQVNRIQREVDIMSKLRHPHLVPLLTHSVCPDSLAMYMPWYDLLDLSENLGFLRGSIPAALTLLCQSSSALTYLHSQSILHRDIKPNNILLTSLSPPSFILTDFGLANYVVKAGFTFAGTRPYTAPEVEWGNAVQLPQTDIWSLGLTVGEVIGYWSLEEMDETMRTDDLDRSEVRILKTPGGQAFSPMVLKIPPDSPIREVLERMLRAERPLERLTAPDAWDLSKAAKAQQNALKSGPRPRRHGALMPQPSKSGLLVWEDGSWRRTPGVPVN